MIKLALLQLLMLRYHIKISFFSEMKQDLPSALRYDHVMVMYPTYSTPAATTMQHTQC